MPVISVDREGLLERTGADQLELLETIPKLGIEIEKIEDQSWNLEVAPDRCDMLSVEGIARSVRGYLEKETGLPDYEVKSSDIVTKVEPSVEDVRPYIVTALIKDVDLDLKFLESLMDIQENLHLTIGRDRARVAIGIHDFDDITPPFTYEGVKPEEASFLPLEKRHEMMLQEILEKHEKGREFRSIIEDHPRYPLITDTDGNVLSFPPIINGQLTEVSPDTKDLFIDMTGTDKKALEDSLNILCTLFAERGATIHFTQISYGGDDQRRTYPDFEPEQIGVGVKETNDVLGVSLSGDEIKQYLARARYNIKDKEEGEGELTVEIPPYRHDILHPYDVIEDIAISHGFDEFGGETPQEVTFGKRLENKELENTLAEILVGYEFQEVMNYSLSTPSEEYEKIASKVKQTSGSEENGLSKLDNPVTEDKTCLRRKLLPQLLSNLQENKKEATPQKLFEIGDVVQNGEQLTMVSGVILHSKAGFTEMKSIMEGLLRDIGIDLEIETSSEGYFIDGRQASYTREGDDIGTFGEVDPKVLENYEIENPTTAFELYLGPLVYAVSD